MLWSPGFINCRPGVTSGDRENLGSAQCWSSQFPGPQFTHLFIVTGIPLHGSQMPVLILFTQEIKLGRKKTGRKVTAEDKSEEEKMRWQEFE